MQPFTANLCCPIIGNIIKAEVAWRDGPDLTTMAEQPVLFRFLMRQGCLACTRSESVQVPTAAAADYWPQGIPAMLVRRTDS